LYRVEKIDTFLGPEMATSVASAISGPKNVEFICKDQLISLSDDNLSVFLAMLSILLLAKLFQ
jgi:hypothetical protein